MNKSEMIERLSDYLPEKRIRHSLNVAKAAVKLCEFCGCDKEKAEIAGYTVVEPVVVLITQLKEIIKSHSHELLGRQEV